MKKYEENELSNLKSPKSFAEMFKIVNHFEKTFQNDFLSLKKEYVDYVLDSELELKKEQKLKRKYNNRFQIRVLNEYLKRNKQTLLRKLSSIFYKLCIFILATKKESERFNWFSIEDYERIFEKSFIFFKDKSFDVNDLELELLNVISTKNEVPLYYFSKNIEILVKIACNFSITKEELFEDFFAMVETFGRRSKVKYKKEIIELREISPISLRKKMLSMFADGVKESDTFLEKEEIFDYEKIEKQYLESDGNIDILVCLNYNLSPNGFIMIDKAQKRILRKVKYKDSFIDGLLSKALEILGTNEPLITLQEEIVFGFLEFVAFDDSNIQLKLTSKVKNELGKIEYSFNEPNKKEIKNDPLIEEIKNTVFFL